MKALFSFIFILTVVLNAQAQAKNSAAVPFNYDIQADRALEFLLVNLDSPMVSPGAVMASPSMSEPDYFYHWTRDAALTMRLFVSYLESSKSSSLEKELALQRLLTWIEFESELQKLPTETGLGEPKYNLDGTAFTGPWGRPQTDGPALRAVTVVRLAKYLLRVKDRHTVERLLTCGDCVITRDLDYLQDNWMISSFDLWEEVLADHFYNRLAQWNAFDQAADLAKMMGQDHLFERYFQVGKNIHNSLQQFVDMQNNKVFASIRRTGGWEHKVSNLDAAVILAVLHSSQPNDLYSVSTTAVVGTARKLEKVFFELYPLNSSKRMAAPAIGRYPEDVYNGVNTDGPGNPWFITTQAMAEFYCLRGETARGLDFLNRALFHAGRDGHMQEQFSHFNGYMLGAQDLSWSYASYLSAYQACLHKLPRLQAQW